MIFYLNLHDFVQDVIVETPQCRPYKGKKHVYTEVKTNFHHRNLIEMYFRSVVYP